MVCVYVLCPLVYFVRQLLHTCRAYNRPNLLGGPWHSWSVSNLCFRQKFLRHVLQVTATSWKKKVTECKLNTSKQWALTRTTSGEHTENVCKWTISHSNKKNELGSRPGANNIQNCMPYRLQCASSTGTMVETLDNITSQPFSAENKARPLIHEQHWEARVLECTIDWLLECMMTSLILMTMSSCGLVGCEVHEDEIWIPNQYPSDVVSTSEVTTASADGTQTDHVTVPPSSCTLNRSICWYRSARGGREVNTWQLVLKEET